MWSLSRQDGKKCGGVEVNVCCGDGHEGVGH